MCLSEKILVVVGGKIILRTGFTAEGFAVADFLQVVQATGNAFIAVTVESVEIDARSAIYTAVNFRAVYNFLTVCIHHARCGRAVGVDKIGIVVSGIIGSFGVAITERGLEGGKGRYGFAVAFSFASPSR